MTETPFTQQLQQIGQIEGFTPVDKGEEPAKEEKPPETIDDHVRQIGKHLAKEFGASDYAGLFNALEVNPYPDRQGDILTIWSQEIAVQRLPIPADVYFQMGEQERQEYFKQYAQIARSEAQDILSDLEKTKARIAALKALAQKK